MNGRCNQISIDEGALLGILQQRAKDGLIQEGERQLGHMRREVQRTTHGDAPGKPAWRAEIVRNLDRVATAVAVDSISMDFGYSPSDSADEVRAMIVNEGSGSAAGGAAIHAGPPGRSVWDEDVSGKHLSRARTEYRLPDEFNQTGNQFILNAMRIMQTEFGDAVEQTLQSTPDSAYYGNVRVAGA